VTSREFPMKQEESHRNFEIAFKLAMNWPTEEASQPEVPVEDGDVVGASTPEEAEAVARPRRRAVRSISTSSNFGVSLRL
jgi:hypothetical protein